MHEAMRVSVSRKRYPKCSAGRFVVTSENSSYQESMGMRRRGAEGVMFDSGNTEQCELGSSVLIILLRKAGEGTSKGDGEKRRYSC